MKRMLMLLALAMITTTFGAAFAPTGIARAADTSPFEFELQQTDSHRGLGVHGYVYNPLPFRITNVRLQLDSLDANGTLVASTSGWVQGDVSARGRAYFYVPIDAPAPRYRARVEAFDKVMLEAPQAP